MEPSKHGHGEGSQEKECTNIETDVRRKLSASMMVSGKKPSNSPGGGFSTASEQVPPREKHDHPNWRFDGSSAGSRVSYMSQVLFGELSLFFSVVISQKALDPSLPFVRKNEALADVQNSCVMIQAVTTFIILHILYILCYLHSAKEKLFHRPSRVLQHPGRPRPCRPWPHRKRWDDRSRAERISVWKKCRRRREPRTGGFWNFGRPKNE